MMSEWNDNEWNDYIKKQLDFNGHKVVYRLDYEEIFLVRNSTEGKPVFQGLGRSLVKLLLRNPSKRTR